MKAIVTRTTIHTTFSLGARLVIQAATLLIVARVLGPHAFGEFAGVASLALTLGTLSSFGTNVVLLSETSKRSPLRETVLCYALPTTYILGSLLFVAYFLVVHQFLHISEMSLTALIAIGISETIVQPLVTVVSAEYQGNERTPESQWLLNSPLFLRMLVALTLWYVQPKSALDIYAYGYVGAATVVLIIAVTTLRPAWPRLAQWRSPTKQEVRHASGFALLNITGISPAELDKTLALRLLPMAAAGVYAAGTRVIGALILPVIAMMLTVLPRMFREHSRGSRTVSHLLRWTLSCASVYSLVLALILWQAAPIVQTVFGERYHGLEEAIRWLCPVLPGMAIRIVAGSSLMSMGKPWARASFEAIGLLVLGLCASALSHYFGLHGMASALACSEWSMAILGCVMIASFHQRQAPISDSPRE